MSIQVQHRRDTTANLATKTPAVAEIGYDTTTNELLYGDGATAGGIKLAKKTHTHAASDTTSGTFDIARIPKDTDGTFAANSDNVVPTQKAAKTYMDGLITALKNGVSSAFDTLAEIAAELALKATSASPTFSGTITAAAATLSGLLTTNGQVKFPSSPNPSADANTLDDYKEAAWTPAVAGVTVTVISASYTKIGNRVLFDGCLLWPSTADGTSILITGLPYTCAKDTAAAIGLAPIAGTLSVDALTSRLNFRKAGGANVVNSEMSGSVLVFGGNYTV